MVSIYQRYHVKTPLPSGQLHHHRVSLVFPYPFLTPWGIPNSPMSHPDSFWFVILLSGSSSSNLFPHFRFGQTSVKSRPSRSSCSMPLLLFFLNLVLFLPDSPPFFYLTLSGTFGRNYSFSFLSGYSVCPVTHFILEMTRPMSWPDEVRCSSHLQLHVVFSSSSSIHSSLLLDWRCTVLTNFFYT